MSVPEKVDFPSLPDGVSVIVKSDCPACLLAADVLIELGQAGHITLYTQDDPAFPATGDWVIDDTDLAVSWHHEIEAVPTLIKTVDGVETERTAGWNRQAWESITGVTGLGLDLVDFKPG